MRRLALGIVAAASVWTACPSAHAANVALLGNGGGACSVISNSPLTATTTGYVAGQTFLTCQVPAGSTVGYTLTVCAEQASLNQFLTNISWVSDGCTTASYTERPITGTFTTDVVDGHRCSAVPPLFRTTSSAQITYNGITEDIGDQSEPRPSGCAG